MDPIKIVVTNSDSTSVTSSTSYEQSQSATELNKTDRTQNAAIAAATAAASAASLPTSLSSTPTPQKHHQHLHQLNSNGTKIKQSINKRRSELPPLKLSTFEPKANTFHLQVDNDHDVDDECRKLLLNPLVNKPFPSSQSTTSLNKRVTISPKSAFSRFEPSQSTGKQKWCGKKTFCLWLNWRKFLSYQIWMKKEEIGHLYGTVSYGRRHQSASDDFRKLKDDWSLMPKVRG